MIAICDIETDGLNPSRIWVICAKNADTGETWTFPEPDLNPGPFLEFAKSVDVWVGHNFLSFDLPVINRLTQAGIPEDLVIDTFICSKLFEFFRKSHSLASYGEEFGEKKPEHEDWSCLSPEMILRCQSDVRNTERVFLRFHEFIYSSLWKEVLRIEHRMVSLSNALSKNGFFFNLKEAKELYIVINKELLLLTEVLLKVFPKKTVLLKEITPVGTKHGTINKKDFRFLGPNPDLSPYSIGSTFSLLEWKEFSPGSPQQRIDRLWDAGWRPTEKTDGHKDFLKLPKKDRDPGKADRFARYGWTTSEANLDTLPRDAPEGIRKLVQWLLVSARVRKLDEWFLAYSAQSGRIHGQFTPIGAWTQRWSHSAPNMGNIFKFNAKQPEKTPYSDVMRKLWTASPGRFLVGVDAEGIQLRVLAHYINDPVLTAATIGGDPHSVNWRALGDPCRSRDAAKTFIYAWLLGAGIGKVSVILDCSYEEAEIACKNFVDRYPGLRYLKDEVIPRDAMNGYFQGFDGRYVRVKGEDQPAKEYYMLGGYLQNGETVVMRHALDLWERRLTKERVPFWLVNFVHDEFQTEVPRDLELAKYVSTVQADSIRLVGEQFGLNCPMAGSSLGKYPTYEHSRTPDGKVNYWAIGDNWMETH